jgi:hypothetical protein
MRLFSLVLAWMILIQSAFAQQMIKKLEVEDLKMPKESAGSALYLDTLKKIKSLTSVSDTELEFLDGVTSPIQTQLNAKEGSVAAGTTSQYYRGDKTWQTLDKTSVGLSNVDNTSDVNKPVSTAQQTALNLKANIASPTFTGTPAAPTATAGTNTTQIATTQFVTSAVASATPADATTTSKGIVQLAGDLSGTAAAPTVPALASKAPLASPALTGTPTAPTATAGTNTTQLATTAFVATAVTAATDPTKISGPASAGDKNIVRYSGTTGKLAQDSAATISDAGDISANSFSAPGTSTTSSFSGLQLNNRQITASTGGNLDLTAADSTGTINLKRKTVFQGRKLHTTVDDTATGANATLADHAVSVVRLTGSGLVSVDGIPAGNGADTRTIINMTGADIFLNNDTGATVANRFYTGTGSNLKVKNNSAVQVTYDVTNQRWYVTSGAGAGGIAAWVTATSYKAGDVIYTNDKIYAAQADHTSGTFSSDLGSLKWKLLSDQFTVSNEQGTQQVIRELRFPKNQITQVSTDIAIAETGNRNRLINPGFEHQTATTGWSSTVTGTATLAKTPNATTPINGIGTSMSLGCSGGASGGTCTFYQDVNTSLARQGLVGIDLISDTASGVEFYSRVNGANNLSLPIKDLNLEFRRIPQTLGTTSTGVAVKITVAASQSILVQVDEGFVGVSDVKVDTPNARFFASKKIVSGGTGCDFTTASSSFSSPSAIAGCNTPTNAGNTTDTTKDPHIRLNSYPAGRYYIVASGAFYNGATNNQFISRITDGTKFGSQQSVFSSTGTVTNNQIVGQWENTTPQASATISVQILSANNTSTVGIYTAGVASDYEIAVYYFPTSNGSTYSSLNADTDWAACNFSTLAWQGFGTVDASQMRCRRQGPNLLMMGRVTLGTLTGSLAQVNLPLWNGNQLSTKGTSVIPVGNNVGRFLRNTASSSGAKDYAAVALPSSAFLNVAMVETSTASSPLSPQIANSMFSSGEIITLENVSVPIEGWENSNVMIANLSGLESCSSTLACTDRFSATTISGAVVAGSENVDWINGNPTISTNSFTYTFNAGIFTATPNCTCTSGPFGAGTSDFTCSVSSVSSTQLVVQTSQQGSGTATAHTLHCDKAAADYIGKTAKAVAGDQNTSVTGKVKYKECRIRSNTACTTATCDLNNFTIHGNCVSSITRAGTGSYAINFNTNFWSEIPICIPGMFWSGSAQLPGLFGTQTLSSVTLATFASGSTSTLGDANYMLSCTGTTP